MEVVLERVTPQSGPTGIPATTSSSHSSARLIVGSVHDDKLLAFKHMVVETFPSPFKVSTSGISVKPLNNNSFYA